MRYQAGLLSGEELECFEVMYREILNMLGKLEKLAAVGKVSVPYVAWLLNTWENSYIKQVRGDNQKSIDRMKRKKEIEELEESGPIKINETVEGI